MRYLVQGLIGVCAAVALCGASLADAAPVTVIGARTLDRGDWAGWAAAGLPDFEFGALFGLASTADAGGRLRLGYGNGQTVGGFGAAAAGVLRSSFASAGAWAFALQAEPGVFVHGGTPTWAPYAKAGKKGAQTLMGVDVGVPALVASVQLAAPTDRAAAAPLVVSLSVGAPARVYFAPELTLELPVFFKVAAQYGLTGPWSLLAGADLGATFYGPGGGSPTWSVESRFRVGVTYVP